MMHKRVAGNQTNPNSLFDLSLSTVQCLNNVYPIFCEMHSCCPDFECGKFAFGDINLDIDCLKCLWNSREFSGDDKMFAVLLWPR